MINKEETQQQSKPVPVADPKPQAPKESSTEVKQEKTETTEESKQAEPSSKPESQITSQKPETATGNRKKSSLKDRSKGRESASSQGQSKLTKVENRDHCNYCKDGGDLICCDNCPRSFHPGKCLKAFCKKNKLPYEAPPTDEDAEWYCPRCKPIMTKRKADSSAKQSRAEARRDELAARRRKQEEEAAAAKVEFERKRDEKKAEKEKQELEKKVQRDQKADELRKAKEEKEKKIQEEKEERQRKLEAEKRQREEKLAEEKRVRQEKLEEQKRQREEKLEAEVTRKKEAADKRETERLARVAEQERVKQEKDAERLKKEEERQAAKERQRIEQFTLQQEKEILKSAGIIQTTLAFGKGERQPGGVGGLSKESIRLRQVCKAQFEIFKRYYPELLDKNQVKYPIDDKLLLQMPELHGTSNLRQPPVLKQVLVTPSVFENLLYIWEFLNNFKDFLDIPKFSLEELQAALKFTADVNDPEQVEAQFARADDEAEPFNWDQRVTMAEIRDHGFNLVNMIHGALVKAIINDLKILDGSAPLPGFNQPNQIGIRAQVVKEVIQNFKPTTEDHENGLLVNEIVHCAEPKQLCEKMWPEIVRVLLVHADERLDFEDSIKNSDEVLELLKKAGACAPRDYTWCLAYQEKVDLLMLLVDCIHDLDSFRQFLNRRLEERSHFFKQKSDLHAEIRKIEQEKADFQQAQKVANSDETERRRAEIASLQEKLFSATRTESRFIHKRLDELRDEESRLQDEMARFDTQINKKQIQIEKIGEKYQSLSVKTSVLGVDANLSEYWLFKDDCQKLFVKKPTKDASELAWFYLDDEEEFDQVCSALNPKGTREKRLLESLRKIKPSLKLKKARASKQQVSNSEGGEPKSADAIEDKEESEEILNADMDQKKHHVFATDDHENALIASAWFTKSYPKRRGPTRHNQELIKSEGEVNLDSIKGKLRKLERLYTECMDTVKREWDTEEERAKAIEGIEDATHAGQLFTIMLQMERGFSDPWQLTTKQNEETNEEETRRRKIQLFKFWRQAELKSCWLRYIDGVEHGEHDGNLNASWIAATLLDKAVQAFADSQVKKQMQKIQKLGGEGFSEAQQAKAQQQVVAQTITQSGRTARQINYKQYFQDTDEEDSDGDMEQEGDNLGMSRRERRAARREQAKWDDKQSESDVDDEEEGEEEKEESEEEEAKAPVPSPPAGRRRGRPPRAEARPTGRPSRERKDSDQALLEKYAFQPHVSRSQRAALRNQKRSRLHAEEEEAEDEVEAQFEQEAYNGKGMERQGNHARDKATAQPKQRNGTGARASPIEVGDDLRDDEIAEMEDLQDSSVEEVDAPDRRNGHNVNDKEDDGQEDEVMSSGSEIE